MAASRKKPTADQIRRWRDWVRQVEIADRESVLSIGNALQFLRAQQYAAKHKIKLDNDPAITGYIGAIAQTLRQYRKLIGLVNNGELGLSMERNGDIDIMAPAGTTSDQVASYQMAGFWLIGIGLGVIVVAGVVIAIQHLRSKNTELLLSLERLRSIAESKFCSDPKSVLCQGWLKRKSESDYTGTEGVIAGATSWLEQAGQAIKTGLSGAAIAAIGLALVWIFLNRNKS